MISDAEFRKTLPRRQWWEGCRHQVAAIKTGAEETIAADLEKTIEEYRHWRRRQRYEREHATGPIVAACAHCGRFFPYQQALWRWVLAGAAVDAGLGDEPGVLSPLAEVRTYCSDDCADRGGS